MSTPTSLPDAPPTHVHGPACHAHGIRGYGAPNAPVAFIGIAPGRDEVRTGRPLTGPSGRLLNNMLDAVGWHRDVCYCTNLICWWKDKPTQEEITPCLERLDAEIRRIGPKVVFLLGEIATTTLLPGRKFGDARGAVVEFPQWGCHLIPTNHPAAILHGGGEGPMRNLMRDLAKIGDVLTSPPDPTVLYTVVRSREQAQHILDALPDNQFVTLDIETTNPNIDAININYDQLYCLSIAVGDSTWVFPADVCPGLKWPTHVEWTGHNMMHDANGVERFLDVNLPIKHDTMYMSYLLDERTTGIHGLKGLSREYEAAGWYEDEIKAVRYDFSQVDPEVAYRYNARDTQYTRRHADRFFKRMKDDGVLAPYHLMIQAANVFRHMAARGVHVNLDRMAELGIMLIEREEQLSEQLTETAVLHGASPYINLNSSHQLGDLLFNKMGIPVRKRTPKGKPSTDKDVMEYLADEYPFVREIGELKETIKMRGTYIMPILEPNSRLRLESRVFPNPLLHGTLSGRLAYNDPAVNTMPRPDRSSPHLAAMRSMFDATPGMVMGEADYSQAEIWGAYLYCRDETMLADLQSGDFHTRTMFEVFRVSPDEYARIKHDNPNRAKEMRGDSKKTTFGMLYLIGAEKLGRQMGRPQHEAAQFMQRWHARYPGYQKYVDWCWNCAVEQGEIVTLTGRKRRFPLVLDKGIINQIVNYPIQSTSHDILLSAIIELHPLLKEFDAHLLLDVHDALLFEAPEKYIMEVARLVKHTMEKPRFPGFPSVPAEIKLGQNWGAMKEVEIH